MKRTKSQTWKKAPAAPKKKKVDPLDRWALTPGNKASFKRCDQAVSTYITNVPTATAILLSTIPQQVGDNGRIGQRVRWHNFQVRGMIYANPQATAIVPPEYVRVIFFYDRQTNAAAPTYQTIIDNIGAGTGLAYDPPNWYQRGRFKIIRDFKLPLPAVSFTVVGGNITAGSVLSVPSPTSTEMEIDFFKALKGKIDCEWNGTGSGINQINGGSIGVVVQSLNSTTTWALDITSTIEFQDV